MPKGSFEVAPSPQISFSTGGVTWRHRLGFWRFLFPWHRKSVYFSNNKTRLGCFDRIFSLPDRFWSGVPPKTA